MPRFFFHRTDGDMDPDQEGVDLPNLQAARIEAVKFAAISVKDHPELVWTGSTFRVEVSDHTGMLLSTVIILEIEAPAARGLRGQRPLDDKCFNSSRDRAID